jgi:anti-sigma-K factor RskA
VTAEIHVLELIPAYALGCLDEEEASLVSNHLANCATCQAELRAYETVVDQMALAVPEVAPSPALKGRLLERLQQSTFTSSSVPPLRRPWLQRLSPAWGLFGLIIILAFFAGGLLLWRQFNPPERAVGPGGMQAISISGVGKSSDATGFVIISGDGQSGAMVVDRLPQLNEAQQYQVWLVREGERSSGAVFSVDEVGYGGVRLRAPRPLLEYSAVEVTIEVAGGSSKPTGDLVLSGLLK